MNSLKREKESRKQVMNDIYMHGFRGSNSRVNKNNQNRQRNNRVFDSQVREHTLFSIRIILEEHRGSKSLEIKNNLRTILVSDL